MKERQLLTIELPEGFKKGQCTICPFSYEIPSYVSRKDWGVFCIFERNPKNCPIVVYDENGKVVKGGISGE